MEDKPFYVTLEAYVPKIRQEPFIFLKKLPQSDVELTVDELVQKLLQPEPNASYTAVERDAADTIRNWFSMGNNHPIPVGIMVFDSDRNHIPVMLEAKVSDYASAIREKKLHNPRLGMPESYSFLELYVDSYWACSYRSSLEPIEGILAIMR
jgi:hypothetical protein